LPRRRVRRAGGVAAGADRRRSPERRRGESRGGGSAAGDARARLASGARGRWRRDGLPLLAALGRLHECGARLGPVEDDRDATFLTAIECGPPEPAATRERGAAAHSTRPPGSTRDVVG